MDIFATIIFIILGGVGLYISIAIIAVGFEAISHKNTKTFQHKYTDGDEYVDQFYVQMPDGSVRID
jgi:hypothetical protein